jgi:hypothetical protein
MQMRHAQYEASKSTGDYHTFFAMLAGELLLLSESFSPLLVE